MKKALFLLAFSSLLSSYSWPNIYVCHVMPALAGPAEDIFQLSLNIDGAHKTSREISRSRYAASLTFIPADSQGNGAQVALRIQAWHKALGAFREIFSASWPSGAFIVQLPDEQGKLELDCSSVFVIEE